MSINTHRTVALIVAIATLAVGVVALIEPRYLCVTDGEICGYKEVTKVTKSNQWKACENINKIEGYKYTEVVESSSGWIGGGKSPIWHCNNLKREKEQAIGVSIHWGEPDHWEENNKDLSGHVTYNYHCKIKAEWGPIYKIERHERCGPADPIAHIIKEPKSCCDTTNRIGWKWRWE